MPETPRRAVFLRILSACLLCSSPGLSPMLAAQCDETELAWSGVDDGEHGSSVSATLDVIVVGSPGALGSGTVTVNRSEFGTWTPTTLFPPAFLAGNARFGSAVAVSEDGQVIVVGAPGHLFGAGAYVIYEYDAGSSTWDPTEEVAASSGTFGALGRAVAVTGSGGSYTVAVGQPNGGPIVQGQVTLRRKSGGSWVSDGVLSGFQTSGEFGQSLALDGTQLLVGSPGVTAGSGRVDFYDRIGGTWTPTAFAALAGGGRFGSSVDLDGEWAIVGAPFYDIVGSADTGLVATYRRVAGFWTHVGPLFVDGAAGARAGSSVAIDGDGVRALVGVPGRSAVGAIPFGFQAGAVILMRFDGLAWNFELPEFVVPLDVAAFDSCGTDVDLAGHWIVYGSPGADHGGSETGAAYVRDLDMTAVHVDVSSGLAGTGGVPVLETYGGACGNTSVLFEVTGAVPNGAFMVLGFTLLQAPFKGGTLVPFPELVLPLPWVGPGDQDVAIYIWPPGQPSLTLHAQFWFKDANGPFGFSSTQGRAITTPGG